MMATSCCRYSSERAITSIICSTPSCTTGRMQGCESGSGVRCFFDPWIRDMFIPDPGSWIPDSRPITYESFVTIFWIKSTIILCRLAKHFFTNKIIFNFLKFLATFLEQKLNKRFVKKLYRLAPLFSYGTVPYPSSETGRHSTDGMYRYHTIQKLKAKGVKKIHKFILP
jgi:hypothetical protein